MIGCVSKYGIVVKFNLSYFGYVNIILQMVFFVFLLINHMKFQNLDNSNGVVFVVICLQDIIIYFVGCNL